MARMRSIKPGFFLNDELAEVPPLGRLLFAGLWTIADREGRLEDRPRQIKVQTLPWDDCDVDALLADLERHGFVVRYQVDGRRYIAIPSWSRHQTPHIQERASIIPPPPEYGACTVLAPYKHGATTIQAPEEHGSSMVAAPPDPEPDPDTDPDPDTARAREAVDNSVDNSMRPVDNSVEKRNGKNRKGPRPVLPSPGGSICFNAATCSGGELCDEPCPAQRRRGVRHLVELIVPGESGQIYARRTQLGRSVAALVDFLCAEAQQVLPSLDRSQREEACQRLLVRAFERAAAAHAKAPIRSLPRYLDGMVAKRSLNELVGDDLVEQLRRQASRASGNGKREGEPQSLAAVIAARKSSPGVAQ